MMRNTEGLKSREYEFLKCAMENSDNSHVFDSEFVAARLKWHIKEVFGCIGGQDSGLIGRGLVIQHVGPHPHVQQIWNRGGVKYQVLSAGVAAVKQYAEDLATEQRELQTESRRKNATLSWTKRGVVVAAIGVLVTVLVNWKTHRPDQARLPVTQTSQSLMSATASAPTPNTTIP